MYDNRKKTLLETIQELLGENKSVYAIFNQDDVVANTNRLKRKERQNRQ